MWRITALAGKMDVCSGQELRRRLTYCRQTMRAADESEIPSMKTTTNRCAWVNVADPIYAEYHDTEWGVPEWDSRALWEKLMLDGFQAGLAWITILRKRETMRIAFDGFDPDKIARYSDADRERLMADPGIIRSKLKIAAAISNAQAYIDMRERGEDFSEYLWGFVGGAPIQNSYAKLSDIPTKTDISEKLSKDLKKRGFKFVGPVIVYAFMEAVGMVNDHELTCPQYAKCQSIGGSR
jgi:DNA-3-methyladenine glycosylase I